MPRLIESTFVTLDGVISESEVWGSPYWDEEHHDYADKLLFDADGLVLGRNAYESFAVGSPRGRSPRRCGTRASCPVMSSRTSEHSSGSRDGTC